MRTTSSAEARRDWSCGSVNAVPSLGSWESYAACNGPHILARLEPERMAALLFLREAVRFALRAEVAMVAMLSEGGGVGGAREEGGGRALCGESTQVIR